MDGRQEPSSGFTLKGYEAPQSFSVAARAENPSHPGAPTMPAAPPVGVAAPSFKLKKKMGRPRKYGPHGPVAAALSPMPISASIPLSGNISGWKQPKRRRFRAVKRAHKVDFGSLGNRASHLVGADFRTHVFTVRPGEDISAKILFLSQQRSQAVCVICATGLISTATLRQPNHSIGTVAYEGSFDIISLSGSFMPDPDVVGGLVRSTSGGVSITLCASDGTLLGGVVAGLLIAASYVQVVVGTFTVDCYQVSRRRRQRTEPLTSVIPAVVTPVSVGGYAPANYVLPDMNSSLDPMDSGDVGGNNGSDAEGDSDEDLDDAAVADVEAGEGSTSNLKTSG